MSEPRVLFVGRSTYDAVYYLDELPEENSKIFANRFHSAPGGPALNAALTYARLGGQAMLLSAVGKGAWAEALRSMFKRSGVKLLDLAAGSEYETPLVSAWVSANGDRTVVNPPAWSGELPAWPALWDENSWGAMPSLMLCDGFHLTETIGFLSHCQVAGAAIVLDGGSWKEGTDRLAGLLTAAICGERFQIPGVAHSTEAVFEWFAAKGVPRVAVTRGERSILGCDGGRRFEIEIETIEAVDTLGAGDVLHGAFCYYFALEPDFESALRQAAVEATRSCLGIGIDSGSGQ